MAITEMVELLNQRPTVAVVGKNRTRGNNVPPSDPSSCTLRRPNSTRPSSLRRATIRTTTSLAARVDVAATLTVNGELRNQRPTATSAGKNRARGNSTSPRLPAVSRWRNPNSTRSSASLRATIRTTVSCGPVRNFVVGLMRSSH